MSFVSIGQDRARSVRARIDDLVQRVLDGSGDHAGVGRGALFAFAIRVASAGIAYLSQILLARWMGTFEFGIFAYVWVWVIILGSIVTAGFNTSVLRFVPEYLETREWALVRGFVRTGYAVAFVLGTFTAAAGAATVIWLGDGVQPFYVLPFVLAFACLPMFAMSDTSDGLARSRSWIDLALGPPYIVRPVLILAFMALAIALGFPATAATAAISAIAATWLVGAAQVAMVHLRMRRDVPSGAARYRLGHWTGVSLPIVLMDGFYLIMAHADIMLLTLFVGPSEIAIYYAVVKTTGLIAFVYFAVTASCAPKFSEYKAAGKTAEFDELMARSIRWTFWPSLAAAGGILAVGWPLLWLFGPDFTAGYGLMFILVVGLLARASTGPVESMMNMLGHQNLVAGVLFGAVAVNIGLNLLLIPVFGLAGAAIATTVSMVLVAGLQYAAARIRVGVHAFIVPRRVVETGARTP